MDAEMSKKFDEVTDEISSLRDDVQDLSTRVSNLHDSFPQSWLKDGNGGTKWRKTTDKVKKNSWVRTGAVWLFGAVTIGVIGLAIRAYEKPRMRRQMKTQVQKRQHSKRMMNRLRGVLVQDAESVIKEVNRGTLDAHLTQLRELEKKNKNRETVLEAIDNRNIAVLRDNSNSN